MKKNYNFYGIFLVSMLVELDNLLQNRIATSLPHKLPSNHPNQSSFIPE